jgi:hypothetical protein
LRDRRVDDRGEPGGSGTGQFVVGCLREGVQLEEVPGDGEAEDAADGKGRAEFGVWAAGAAGEVGDAFVQVRLHRLGCLGDGQH